MVKGNIKTLGCKEKEKVPLFVKGETPKESSLSERVGKGIHDTRGKASYDIKKGATVSLETKDLKDVKVYPNLKVAIESIIKELESFLDHNDFKDADKATNLVYRNLVYRNIESAKKHLKHGLGYIKK